MKRRIDAAPYLSEGERVIEKSFALPSKARYAEVTVALLLFAFCIVGDCFILGVLIGAKENFKNAGWAMPLLIVLFAVHLAAFVMWFAAIMKGLADKADRWYVLTDKRILILSSGFPAGAHFISLKDITSVKFDGDKITVYSGEERLTLSHVENCGAFAASLENRLDEIFDEQKQSDAEADEVVGGLKNEGEFVAEAAGTEQFGENVQTERDNSAPNGEMNETNENQKSEE